METSGEFADKIIDNAEAQTLKGDIRDALLTHVRSIKVPWAMLAEDEQQQAISAITNTAEHAVRGVAKIMAVKGFAFISVHLGKWTVNDGVKLEVNATANTENIMALAEHGVGGVLVLADAAEYFGERGPAKPDKDQPELPIAAE